MLELLTKREAAQRIRVSERTLDRLIADGNGPTITRIGARVLFRVDHMGEWIENRNGPPASPATRALREAA